MLRIGEFSKLGRVTIKALRYYDDVGLLRPAYTNPENGYRFYNPAQLNILTKIIAYKNMGLTLEEIIVFLEKKLSQNSLCSMLEEKCAQLAQVVVVEQQKLSRIQAYLKKIKESVVMNEVNIKELPDVVVASMRLIIPDYNALFTVAPNMGEKMKQHGAVCSLPPYCFNIYHDGEYKESNIDIEICEAVEKKLPDADNIVYKNMPGYKTAACIFHKGSYQSLGESYAEIFKWIEANNYRIIGNQRESYIDGIWNKENENDWLTEIQVPVSK